MDRSDSENTIKGLVHPRDIPLRSTPRDIEAFMEGIMWKDMEMTIKDRIEILTDELIFQDDREEIMKLQQEVRVWKEMLALPSYLLEHAKIEQQLKEQNNAEN